MSIGDQLRDRALDRLAALRTDVVTAGRRALLVRLLDRGVATADDVRAKIDMPAGVDPVCLGAVPLPLARAGLIERSGYVSTERAEGHARPVVVWRLVDRAAALRWLAENPAPEPAARSQGLLFDLGPPETNAGGTTATVPPASESARPAKVEGHGDAS